MTMLREDKKRDVLAFLEESAESNDSLVELEEDRIVEAFADETFDEEAIADILDELESEDVVERRTAKLSIVYPASATSVEDRFEDLFESPSVLAAYSVGFLVCLTLFRNSDAAFTFLFGDATGDPTELVVQGMLFGVFGTYLLGRAVVQTYEFVRDNFEILYDHRRLLLPIPVIAVVVGVLIAGFTTHTDQPLTTSHFIQILSISILGGIPIGKLISDRT